MKDLGQLKSNSPTQAELDEITARIIGCAHKVSNTLGIGFVEKVYENAHAYELRKNELEVCQQFLVQVAYDGRIIGDFYVDLLVEHLVLVELKAVSTLTNEHMMQALNYLRASGLPACLLINFGQPRIQIRRLHPSPLWKSPVT